MLCSGCLPSGKSPPPDLSYICKWFAETLGSMWEALPEVCRGQIVPHLHISNHNKVPRAPRQYGILDVFVLWPLDDTLRKSALQRGTSSAF